MTEVTDWRALCARMADELDHYRQLLTDDRGERHALATEARAALAEPQGEGAPTVMQIIELAEEIEAAGLGQVDLVRAALARWGRPAAPPLTEALAARPMLEQVARMGDRVGAHAMGELMVSRLISDRAAAWLRDNPPGRPVAIEPRGCPTPGACSCVEAAQEPPAEGEVADFASWLAQEMPAGTVISDPLWWAPRIAARAAALLQQPPGEELTALAREVWDLVAESQGVAGLHLNGDIAPWEELLPGGRFERLSSLPEPPRDINTEVIRPFRPALEPPVAGEVAELVEWLRELGAKKGGRFDVSTFCANLTRTADLLTRLALQPVPVKERPWEREGWCDDEGRCWCMPTLDGPPPRWWLIRPEPLSDGFVLPAHALPLPAGDADA